MLKKTFFLLASLVSHVAFGQKITFQNQVFEAKNVAASVVKMGGESVLKVERDLKALPFDVKNMGATTDGPTFLKLQNVDFEDGKIEVNVFSRLQKPLPFEQARGFIGLAFRIVADDSAFESIYLRPTNGTARSQFFRNRAVQYFSFPDHKFERLRKESPAAFEASAKIDTGEWVAMRLEIEGEKVELFINGESRSSLLVEKMLGQTRRGAIGLWVDIGTEGYFKDLKITKKGPKKTLRHVFQPAEKASLFAYGDNPEAGRFVQSGDAKIYFETYGKGEPLVILHGGLLGSTVEMADFIERLQADFQVIAVSTRGHGKSELGREPMSLEQRARDAKAVLDAVSSEKAIILGFSDGGYAALQMGAMFPERIEKMVVMGAGELRPGLREFKITAEQAQKMDTAFWAQQLRLMPEPTRLDEIFLGVTDFYSQATVGKEMLEKIKCPVLMMAGDADDGNPVERVVGAARMIRRHQIGIVPGAGHGFFLENFGATWAMVEVFLGE